MIVPSSLYAQTNDIPFPRQLVVPQLATLFSWYSALLILWIRRPWYDSININTNTTAWGENDSMSLNEADEDEVRPFFFSLVCVFCGDRPAPLVNMLTSKASNALEKHADCWRVKDDPPFVVEKYSIDWFYMGGLGQKLFSSQVVLGTSHP